VCGSAQRSAPSAFHRCDHGSAPISRSQVGTLDMRDLPGQISAEAGAADAPRSATDAASAASAASARLGRRVARMLMGLHLLGGWSADRLLRTATQPGSHHSHLRHRRVTVRGTRAAGGFRHNGEVRTKSPTHAARDPARRDIYTGVTPLAPASHLPATRGHSRRALASTSFRPRAAAGIDRRGHRLVAAGRRLPDRQAAECRTYAQCCSSTRAALRPIHRRRTPGSAPAPRRRPDRLAPDALTRAGAESDHETLPMRLLGHQSGGCRSGGTNRPVSKAVGGHSVPRGFESTPSASEAGFPLYEPDRG
jgi:hypothetical protein